MSLVGQQLGKYRVVEQVGRGGMGTVYRAVDETLHRDVALKILNAELNDPGVGRRFRAEAVAIARLNHPGIATIFELFQHDGQWLMAIEFVRGETLEDLIARQGPISVDRAGDIVSQALAALGHAHGMGVVHRDLKPANLMLGESGRLKVMDFGIARVAGTEHLTSAGFLVGTPAYMAPEQVLGQEIDVRTDLYAMGCVLFFLTTGKLPFKGTTPMELAQSRIKDTPTPIRDVRPDLPEWLEQVVYRALSRDPAQRHQSADELREALRRGTAGLPLTIPSSPATLPALTETVLPGRLPVSSQLAWPPSAPLTPAATPVDDLSTAETRLLRTGPQEATPVLTPAVPPTVPPTVQQTVPLPKRGTPLWPVLAAVAIVVVGGVWWFTSRGTPPATPPVVELPPPPVMPVAPPPVVPVPDPAITTAPPPAPTSPPETSDPGAAGRSTPPGAVPGASGVPATTGTPGATPPRATGPSRRGAPPPEVSISFPDAKLLRVSGRRGEDFDAELRFGNGAIVVAPRRAGVDQLSLPYRELQRATFVRADNPKWVTGSTPALAAPPDNLDVPRGAFGRPTRRWLVLQSMTWFVVLILPDDTWEQVLNTVEERTRVKIDRPGPPK